MNRSIRFASIFALLLTVILIINLTVVMVFSEDKYAKNALDRRQYYKMASIARGSILASDGTVLAHSIQGTDGFYSREYVDTPIQWGPVEGFLSDIYGAAGLEQGYNSVLDGSDASLFKEHWMDTLLGKATAGTNIQLSLIPSVQKVAYEGLASKGYEGAVVAIQPSTGAILAMASTPSYDPALISNNNTAESTWAQYLADSGSPLLNHATQDPLPPGSTFKVITTAAALANGVTPDTTGTAASQITLPDSTTTLENYGGEHCGSGSTATLTTAFGLSCNTYFAELGAKLGADALNKAASDFGISDTYDLGIPMTAGTVGNLSDAAARAQSSIGQRDVTMSVLENAVVAATVANGGKRMKPYIVASVQGVKTTSPTEINQAISPENAKTLTQLMITSERWTSGYAGADIASKTGTAEHGEDSRNSNPHAWYIAFGPSSNADVAVAVVVKNGGNRGQAATGGSVAAPIGRAVIAAAEAALKK
ncbi:MAG: penicillin-binding transpeptidase domain-containing protein [Corynebacterium sp.]|nr:penicillin-binding transpeptidase domain-containing protein [Corynebacterium sp.]